MSSRNDRIRRICIAVVLAAWPMMGCVIREKVDPVTSPRIDRPSPPTSTAESLILGYSVQNRPITAQVFGRGGDCILIMATIHGDEAAGTPLLNRLAKYLESHSRILLGRKIILIPVVNPDGFKVKARYNANGVDLNRNFLTKNRKNNSRYGSEALSEPEARAIATAIRRFKPDRIVSIHQPAACIDYDGPASDLAQRMAKAGKLKVRRLGAKPGSLGSWAGVTLGIQIITVELPGRASRKSVAELWGRYGEMLLSAIERPAG